MHTTAPGMKPQNIHPVFDVWERTTVTSRLILDNPESPGPKNHTDYLKHWEKSMSDAYKIAAKNAEQWKAKVRERHNSKGTLGMLKTGDRVLMCNLSQCGGPGKLRSH